MSVRAHPAPKNPAQWLRRALPGRVAALLGAMLALATAAGAAGAAAPPLRWSAALEAGEARGWRLEDTLTSSDAAVWRLQRRVVDATGRVRYASVVHARPGEVAWSIETGHPAQRARIRITPGRVVALDADGRERWRAVPDAPICLPELMADLAVQADAAARTREGLRCLVPIDKARKLAPLRLRRLADGPDGVRRYEVGPGSLGMRLFFGRQRMDISADGRRLLGVQGQLEVVERPDGRLRYLEGSVRYAVPRALRTLPAVLSSGSLPP